MTTNGEHNDSQMGQVEKLAAILQLIENVLRFQVLTNSDVVITAISDKSALISSLLTKIPILRSDFAKIQTDEDINSVKDAVVEVNDLLKEVQKIADSIEVMIKDPIRKQMKSLSVLRKFTIPEISKKVKNSEKK